MSRSLIQSKPSWSWWPALDAEDRFAVCCLCMASPSCQTPEPQGLPAPRQPAISESPPLLSTGGSPSPSPYSTMSPHGSCKNKMWAQTRPIAAFRTNVWMFVAQTVCSYPHRSMLSAHRLRTVIPTEAFWMNGINLHTYTPNGQSSAISCRKINNRENTMKRRLALEI